MAEEITYRCPECDTYSGTFTPSENGFQIIHSTCGRAGTPASFTRGTPEYEAVYDHQEGEIDWEDENREDDDFQGSPAQAAQALASDLSTQAWMDLAPHLSCREAEVVKAFLLAWRDEWTAQAFIEAHSLSDDDPSDLHHLGGE
jgi:hypothetical protein